MKRTLLAATVTVVIVGSAIAGIVGVPFTLTSFDCVQPNNSHGIAYHDTPGSWITVRSERDQGTPVPPSPPTPHDAFARIITTAPTLSPPPPASGIIVEDTSLNDTVDVRGVDVAYNPGSSVTLNPPITTQRCHLIVWSENTAIAPSPLNYEVFGLIVRSDGGTNHASEGNLYPTKFNISNGVASPSLDDLCPRVVSDGTHWLVAWHVDDVTQTGNNSIRYRIVNGNSVNTGHPTLTPNFVTAVTTISPGTTAANPLLDVTVAYNQAVPTYIIGWKDSTAQLIQVRTVNTAGGQTNSVVTVDTAASTIPVHSPSITSTRAPGVQEFLITWQEDTTAGNGDIMGRLLTGTGAVQGAGSVIIDSSTSDQVSPICLHVPAQQQYFVGWMEASGIPPASTYNIQCAHLSVVAGPPIALMVDPVNVGVPIRGDFQPFLATARDKRLMAAAPFQAGSKELWVQWRWPSATAGSQMVQIQRYDMTTQTTTTGTPDSTTEDSSCSCLGGTAAGTGLLLLAAVTLLGSLVRFR